MIRPLDSGRRSRSCDPGCLPPDELSPRSAFNSSMHSQTMDTKFLEDDEDDSDDDTDDEQEEIAMDYCCADDETVLVSNLDQRPQVGCNLEKLRRLSLISEVARDRHLIDSYTGQRRRRRRYPKEMESMFRLFASPSSTTNSSSSSSSSSSSRTQSSDQLCAHSAGTERLACAKSMVVSGTDISPVMLQRKASFEVIVPSFCSSKR